jgi:phosphoadenosine phosphosulfate reductase
MSCALHQRVDELNRRYTGADTKRLLAAVIGHEFDGSLVLVSSFGAESAVLLHLAAEVDAGVEVVFVNTGKLFGETRRYRDLLTGLLGLGNVRTIEPDFRAIANADPRGMLFRDAPDLCCHLRKVEPLRRALEGYDAWISGRKRFQSAGRANVKLFEAADGRIKISPLAHWTPEMVSTYAARHALPPHPLVEDGFLSIGCMPCTDRVRSGEHARAGRWRGAAKDECGIHLDHSPLPR